MKIPNLSIGMYLFPYINVSKTQAFGYRKWWFWFNDKWWMNGIITFFIIGSDLEVVIWRLLRHCLVVDCFIIAFCCSIEGFFLDFLDIFLFNPSSPYLCFVLYLCYLTNVVFSRAYSVSISLSYNYYDLYSDVNCEG